MRALFLALVALGLATLLFTRAEPLGPKAVFDALPTAIGRTAPVRMTASDRGSGLARVELRLVPQNGAAPVVLAEQDFPRLSWIGSGVHEATLEATLDQATLPEGPATLEAWAWDHSWLSVLRSGPRTSQPVTVDLTPPTVAVLTSQHRVRLGGSESVVFRVSDDTVESGVRVGELFFPATSGLFADPTLRAALFAVPWNQPGAKPQVVAKDAAGNWGEVGFDVTVQPRTFATKPFALSQDFLAAKVPELLAANGLDQSGTLVDGYLRINRDLRKATEVRVQEITRESADTPLWEGAFMRLPNGAPLSGFADQRIYSFDGTEIDRQTHLGYDLASLKRAVVPAANGGRVVFAGPLGIYGDTVILDHGLGLFSLYGHLSEIGVREGVTVAKGDAIGRTGVTGLAGGDHLHYSNMIHGTHVDPVEWWDGHWIHDHVGARLAAHPRAPQTPAALAGAAAADTPAPARRRPRRRGPQDAAERRRHARTPRARHEPSRTPPWRSRRSSPVPTAKLPPQPWASSARRRRGGGAIACEASAAKPARKGDPARALPRAQRGVAVPEPAPAPVAAAPPARSDLEGWVSAVDGRGDRLVWLVRTLPDGTTLLVDAAINEPDGLREVHLAPIARKQLRALRERIQKEADVRLVPADARALDALLVEAQARAGTTERGRDYTRIRARLTSEPPAEAAELRSSLASPPSDDERPALLREAPALLALPELRTWWPTPEAAAPFLAAIAGQRDSPIVLAPVQQEERLRSVLADAARALFPAAPTARRLEATAYVLAETGRVPAARQTLACAQALRAQPDAPDDVPLLAALVHQSIGAMLAMAQTQAQDERRDALVLTPQELRARSSSRPGPPRG
ncbi:MAG: M23 family metallopeptidase [bacterium]|nr:M23 family metallopeptidase [bacterium]